jgi:hypothetical protein
MPLRFSQEGERETGHVFDNDMIGWLCPAPFPALLRSPQEDFSQGRAIARRSRSDLARRCKRSASETVCFGVWKDSGVRAGRIDPPIVPPRRPDNSAIGSPSLHPTTFAASFANPVALGTLELGSDFDQFTTAGGARWARRLVTVVVLVVHDRRCSRCRQIVELKAKHPL